MRFLIAILFCWSCVAASTTTKTVKESGGDYTTLSAWEAGRQADIVAGDRIELASIEESWTNPDTTSVTISGWTTDATRYICITNSTSKHDGKQYASPSTCYRLEPASNNNAVTISEEYVRIYGLCVKITVSSATYAGYIVQSIPAGGSGIVIGYSIATASLSSTGAGYGYYCADGDATVSVFNSVSYGFLNGTTSCRGYIINGGTFNVYNCLSFGDYVSYRNLSGTMNVYNSIAQGWSSDGFNGTIGGDYNVSEGADDPPGSNPADQTVNVVFVSESAPYDFHLSASDTSGVKDATSDQSGGLFADDIDYVTRSGSWDIGADEYVAAATSAGQIIIIRQQ